LSLTRIASGFPEPATGPSPITATGTLNGLEQNTPGHPANEDTYIDDDDDADLYGEDVLPKQPSIISPATLRNDAKAAIPTDGSNISEENYADPKHASRPAFSQDSRRKLARRIEEMKARLLEREKEKERQTTETSEIVATQPAKHEEAEEGEINEDDEYDPFAADEEVPEEGAVNDPPIESNPKATDTKAQRDEGFLEVAKANNGDKGAEWRFDSSDAESSDTSSEASSDDDSEEESEEEYELLDAQEQAKILMRDIVDADEDGGAPQSGPLRTANEHDEIIPPKPDITVTPDMRITRLGTVENIIEGIVVIKADTAGDYQVLEYGSALCLEDRTVIGSVMDTLSRVREPRYTMGFKDPEEVEALGITVETPIYYVEDHSKTLFTKPLQGMKFTDASNMDDEEADEMEFSDDEKEAEYKRNLKQAKRAQRDARRDPLAADGEPTLQKRKGHPDSVLQPVGRTEINYDDEGDDQMYHKLSRPDNLHNMTPFSEPTETWSPHRGGRGRGRGNFRGQDRGRGGRGRGSRDRVRDSPYGRNKNNDRHRNRGPSNFGSNNRGTPSQAQQASPNLTMPAPSSSPAVSTTGNPPSFSAHASPQYHPAGSDIRSPAASSPSGAWGNQAAQNPAATLQTLLSLPPGSHINPAFFLQQINLLQQQLQTVQSPPAQPLPQWPTNPQQSVTNAWPASQSPHQPQTPLPSAYAPAYSQTQPGQAPQHQFGPGGPSPSGGNQNTLTQSQLFELLRSMASGTPGSQ